MSGLSPSKRDTTSKSPRGGSLAAELCSLPTHHEKKLSAPNANAQPAGPDAATITSATAPAFAPTLLELAELLPEMRFAFARRASAESQIASFPPSWLVTSTDVDTEAPPPHVTVTSLVPWNSQ